MGFRREGKQVHQQRKQWSGWLSKHSDLIAASRLPASVLANEMVWLDLLDHGYIAADDDVPGFSLDELSSEQKAALLELISTRPDDLETSIGWSLTANRE